MKHLFLLLALLKAALSFAQIDKIEVGLVNGQKLYPNTLKIKDPLLKKAYLLLDEEKEILLNEVDFYSNEDGYFIIRDIGLSSDQTLKQVVEGKLPVYSHFHYYAAFTPVMGPNGMMNTPTGRFKEDYYYEKYRSLQLLTLNNLKYDLKDHDESMAKLKKIEHVKFLRIGGWILGGVTALVGLSKMVNDANAEGPPYDDVKLKPNAAFVGGTVLMVVPFFIGGNQQKRLLGVVREYNANDK